LIDDTEKSRNNWRFMKKQSRRDEEEKEDNEFVR